MVKILNANSIWMFASDIDMNFPFSSKTAINDWLASSIHGGEHLGTITNFDATREGAIMPAEGTAVAMIVRGVCSSDIATINVIIWKVLNENIGCPAVLLLM